MANIKSRKAKTSGRTMYNRGGSLTPSPLEERKEKATMRKKGYGAVKKATMKKGGKASAALERASGKRKASKGQTF
jgi:hypothetical protein